MQRDRIIASILAGAIGDGWGRPYEGRPPPPRVEIPRQLLISDDTQLTLATCEAVIEARRVDPERIAASFVKWFREGSITGMGSSTLKALRDLDAGAHWALSGAKGEHAAGNGAAMRVAPLAFVLDTTIPEHRTTLREVCRITHHHDEGHRQLNDARKNLGRDLSRYRKSTACLRRQREDSQRRANGTIVVALVLDSSSPAEGAYRLGRMIQSR